jgi:hypothetical protein
VFGTRVIFAAHIVFVVAGIVVYTVVGLSHN